MAGVCYFVNAYLIGIVGIDETSYSRYVSPFVEEFGKALVIVVLIRAHRIGFLVDAAIFGFAVGTGFAIVENIYYQHLIPDAGLGIWIVRGFGTAIMHGGTTAIFAMMGLAMRSRSSGRPSSRSCRASPSPWPCIRRFNHMFLSPRLSTLTVIVVLPPMLFWVFQRSERAVADWLGQGFDADSQMLESISSGGFSDSPAGKYLESLKHRFRGPIVADLLCYLRLYTELALRAKGIMMMRENGFDIPVDEETRAKFTELRYLERSMGKTGMLAIHPMLHMSHKDLWQLYMLGHGKLRFLDWTPG